MIVLKTNGRGEKVILNTYVGTVCRNGHYERLEGVNLLVEGRDGSRHVVADTDLLDPKLASLIRADWLSRYGPQGSNWINEVHGPYSDSVP